MQDPWRNSDPEREPLLIQQAKAGESHAFSELVGMHQGVLRAYIAGHVRRAEVADDLSQEAFVRAYDRLDQFDLSKGTTIRPWLLGIARNLVFEYLRAETRLGTQVTGDVQRTIDAQHLQCVGSENESLEKERELEALRLCLQKLGAPASALVAQHYFQQQTLVQLAAEEKKRESTIRMQLLRIREVLRVCIQRHLVVDGVAE